MKVLHFYKTYYPDSFGGVEKFIEQLTAKTICYGVQATILTLTTERKISAIHTDKYTLYRVPLDFTISSSPFSIKAIRLFKQLQKQADLIHYHFPWPFADILHFVTRVNKPTIVTYHSDIIKQRWLKIVYAPVMRAFLNSMDAIVATSPNYAKNSEVLSKVYKKVKVIPIGLERENDQKISKEKLTFWRDKFGSRFFLFVGAMRYYKGLEFLIEAAKAIEAPIVIAGAYDDCGQSLKDRVKKENIKNIYFLDNISEQDKIALLTLCYGVVFPSCLRSEAFGIFLLEGAMYGKPMISCEIGTGTTYINIHNKTGIVIPPCDVSALQQAMQFLLDHPETATAMGENAQKRYSQLFTADIMAKQYISLYQDIIKTHSETSV